MSEEQITPNRLRTISKSGWLGTAGETSAMAKEIIEWRARVTRLAFEARRLIAENTDTAESTHGPGEDWATLWDTNDPENHEIVIELTAWCDSVEALLRGAK